MVLSHVCQPVNSVVTIERWCSHFTISIIILTKMWIILCLLLFLYGHITNAKGTLYIFCDKTCVIGLTTFGVYIHSKDVYQYDEQGRIAKVKLLVPSPQSGGVHCVQMQPLNQLIFVREIPICGPFLCVKYKNVDLFLCVKFQNVDLFCA